MARIPSGRPAGRPPNPNLEAVVFEGYRYSRQPGTRYYRRMVKKWRDDLGRYVQHELSLHREIYRSVHGGIPDGFDIHHKDDDWNNNDPSNLVAITKSAHGKHHRAFDKWNKTPAAVKQRKDAQRKSQAEFAARPGRDVVCPECGTVWTTKLGPNNPAMYCSGKCFRKAYARRKRGGG